MRAESDVGVDAVSGAEWDSLLKQFSDANYRQLSAYSTAAAARVGARSENVAIRAESELLGLCNVRIRKLPVLPFGIAYVNGGPVIEKAGAAIEQTVVLSSCLKALQHEYVDRRGYVLRVVGVARAGLLPDVANQIFLNAGFLPCEAKGEYRTILVDIERGLPEIRRSLDQKWRNVLNKAERQDLEIVRGTEATLFRQFGELLRALVARKRLDIDLGPDFFLNLQDDLQGSDQFVVHLAMKDGSAVAGHIGAFHGDTAVYLLGASNEAGLKSNASYLLQWRVIEYAKERACRWYDLGGIDPEGNPDVYRFKARISGLDLTAPGPYEAGTSARRALVRSAESLYRMVRR